MGSVGPSSSGQKAAWSHGMETSQDSTETSSWPPPGWSHSPLTQATTLTTNTPSSAPKNGPPLPLQFWQQIGRGYAHTNTNQNEDLLNDIQKSTQDTTTIRSNPPFGNMFDRLTATAKHLHTYLAPDNKGTGEWITKLKDRTCFFTNHYEETPHMEPKRQPHPHLPQGEES